MLCCNPRFWCWFSRGSRSGPGPSASRSCRWWARQWRRRTRCEIGQPWSSQFANYRGRSSAWLKKLKNNFKRFKYFLFLNRIWTQFVLGKCWGGNIGFFKSFLDQQKGNKMKANTEKRKRKQKRWKKKKMFLSKNNKR